MHVRPALVCILALVAAAGPAQEADPRRANANGDRTGVLRGVVKVHLRLPAPAARPDTNSLVTPGARDLPDRRASVVYLESAPRGAFEPSDRPRARLDQRNEAFHPYVLAIQAGTLVDFPNSDPFFHNVFSLSKPQRFDLGRYPQGRSRSVRFDTPGIVRVFCDIHSHMSAYILVFAHRFFAATDTEGRFSIDGIPAGSYSVSVWIDGKVRQTRSVSIPAEGVAEADFEVR
jgi:plastocyanin